MFRKLCIGIICGGCSTEYDVSIKSAICIANHIDRDRFEVLILCIDKKGDWYLDRKIDSTSFLFDRMNGDNNNNNNKIILDLKNNPHRFVVQFNTDMEIALKVDVVFPIIHGELGEDGSLQGLLRVMDIPFVGSDVLGSSISMEKDITKRILRDLGCSVVPFKTFWVHERYRIDFNDLVDNFGLPFFVKPSNQGSSVGITKIVDNRNFDRALNVAFSYSNKILVEPAIVGREIECAVLGNTEPQVSVCGEIIFKKKSDFYSYCNKYVKCDVEVKIPALISAVISDRVRDIALRVFQGLNCFGMARVDFFLDKNDTIFVNEVNTLPGFTNNSMYSKLWIATGMNLRQLISNLIELALDRHRKRHQLVLGL